MAGQHLTPPIREKGRRIANGYVHIYEPTHPRAVGGMYVKEHILIAERTLGKPLPDGAVIHHVDENRSNNTNSNLVICQDDIYHHFLHLRMRALRESGHVSWRKCTYCQTWDDPAVLWKKKHWRGFVHLSCHKEYMKVYLKRYNKTYVRKRKSRKNLNL